MYFPLQVVLDNRPRRHLYFLNSQSHMFHRYPHNTIIPLLLVAVLNASFGAHVYLSEEMKLMDPMCQFSFLFVIIRFYSLLSVIYY